jgi:hypothetical protein
MLALAEFLCVNPDVFFIPKVNENETKYTNWFNNVSEI